MGEAVSQPEPQVYHSSLIEKQQQTRHATGSLKRFYLRVPPVRSRVDHSMCAKYGCNVKWFKKPLLVPNGAAHNALLGVHYANNIWKPTLLKNSGC